MIHRDMPELAQALNRQSYEWLFEELPDLAHALELTIKHGVTADEVRHFVMRHTQRPALAMRLQQAAEYLLTIREGAK